MTDFLFSHARIALKYGLISLNFSSKDLILGPDYVCDVILHPINDLNIKYSFYSLNDDLTPNWSSVEKALNSNARGILMIHYFGQPQNIEDFQNFCLKHNLYLIEDNAHGFGGVVDGKNLGTFGDIGFNSPRKTLNLNSGGQLLLKDVYSSQVNENFKLLPRIKVFKFKFLISKMINLNEFLKSNLKFLLKKQPKYWEPNEFHEKKVIDQKIDFLSEKKLKSVDFDNVYKKRRALYIVWQKFAVKKGLTPVFSKLHDGAIPLIFPAYISSKDERRRWFNWGWENRYNVHSWPTLPKLVVEENRPGFIQWKKIICFPIDLTMDVDLLEKKLRKF